MTDVLIWNAHLAATWTMVGLIWFVQIVEYPLLARLAGPAFAEAHALHMKRTGPVVVPPMLVELGTLAVLLWRPGFWSGIALWLSAAGLLGIWASTMALQAPTHGRLAKSPEAETKGGLVRWNWIRTVLWTGRGFALLMIQIRAS